MPRAPRSTVGIAPTDTRHMIDPCWFAWSTKHAAEHVGCQAAHDRAIFAAGYLIGGGESARLASQINPAFHDAIRLLLFMNAAAEEMQPDLMGRLREIVHRFWQPVSSWRLSGEGHPPGSWSAIAVDAIGRQIGFRPFIPASAPRPDTDAKQQAQALVDLLNLCHEVVRT